MSVALPRRPDPFHSAFAWFLLALLTATLITMAGCATLREAARPEVVHSRPDVPSYVVVLVSATGVTDLVFESDVLPSVFYTSVCAPRYTPVSDGPELSTPTCPRRTRRAFRFTAFNRIERVALYEEAY
jgi:hypothetical protein